METNILISKNDNGTFHIELNTTYNGDTSEPIMSMDVDYIQQIGNIIVTIPE